MTDFGKNYKEETVSKNYSVEGNRFHEKSRKNSESQLIVINFYSGNDVQKTNKLIQTGSFESLPLKGTSVDLLEAFNERKRYSFAAESRPSSQSRNYQYSRVENKRSFTPIKKSGRSMSDAKGEEKSMDSKPRPGKGSAKVVPELERKRLEAELKAAEEIARLKQSVIEKRLALELATIHDGNDYPGKMQCPMSHAEMQSLEELAMKKQSLIEMNLAQELENLDNQSWKKVPPQCSSPSNIPPPPKHSFSQSKDSSSSVIRSGFLDKKLHLDRKFSGHSSPRGPNPINYASNGENRFQESRQRREIYYQPQQDYQPQPAAEEAPPGKALMAWKIAVAKIKKRIKSKSCSADT